MAIQAGNVAPTAVVVTIAGFLCWSYWDDVPPTPPTNSKLPEIGAELLHPSLSSAADRDPFGTTVAFQLEVDEDADNPNKSKFPRIKGKADATTGLGAKPGAPVRKITGQEATDLLAGLVLNATYIQADRKVALINGRTYARGQALDAVDSKTGPFLLSEIYHHKVVLDYQGGRLDLGYPNFSKPPSKLPGKQPPSKTVQHSAGPRQSSPPTRSRAGRAISEQGARS